MNRSEKFVKLINELIRAYKAIENQKLNEDLLSFGDYTKDDIVRTTYFILKSELPRFQDFTKEEFEKLTPEENIEALSEVLNTPQRGTIPQNLEEMIENYDRKPIGEASTNGIDIKAVMNTPEARLRRMLNSMEIDEAISEVTNESPVVIDPEHVSSISLLLANVELKKEFDTKLIQKIAEKTGVKPSRSEEIAKFIIERINTALPGDEFTSVDFDYIKNTPSDKPLDPEKLIEIRPSVVTGKAQAETQINSFWYSPISAPVKAVLWGGAEKLAEENPEQATAIALAGRKVKEKELRGLKDVAMASGVTLQQWDLLESNLEKIELKDWVGVAYATGISGIDNETANKLFQGGGINFFAIAPTHNFLGGVPFNIGKNVLGNRVKGYLKDKVLKKAAEKVAASAIGKVATGLLSSLNAVAPGVGQIIAVIGGKIIGWLASKALPFIKKHLGWIFGGLGMLVGFPVFGVVGAVAGGVIGAAAAGAITTGTIAGGISVLSAAFIALTTAVLSAIAVPLVITLVGIPIVVALILFIINSGAYIVPPGAGIGGSLTNTTTGGGVSFPVSCTKEQLRLKFSDTSSSPIAHQAWIITNNLYQGFWCDWNRSPNYPGLFDVNMYAINPNPPYPGPIQGYPEALFWCAWLVSKAYESANVPMVQTAGVIVLRDYYLAHGRIIPPNIASGNPTDPNYVPPGSAVFMNTSKFQWGHVGVVYSVNQDGFVFVQSDAGTKDGSFTFNTNGVGVQSSNIAGFGVLK